MNEIYAEAVKLFKAKLATGRYEAYDEDALNMLFEDCVKQCVNMRRVNK